MHANLYAVYAVHAISAMQRCFFVCDVLLPALNLYNVYACFKCIKLLQSDAHYVRHLLCKVPPTRDHVWMHLVGFNSSLKRKESVFPNYTRTTTYISLFNKLIKSESCHRDHFGWFLISSGFETFVTTSL